ncbi:MAG: Ger(x)C family spore germination protein [Desulfitobacterium sp.]
MKYRSILYLLCLMMALMVSGCWNYSELKELSISYGLGIDQLDDGQIQLTLLISLPMAGKSSSQKSNSNGGEEKGYWVTTMTGRTLFEALSNGRDQVSRKTFLAQNKVIIIGEEAAKNGISPLLDLAYRRHDVRELNNVFIAKGKAQDILEAKSEQEENLAKALENLVEATGSTSKATKTTLLDVMKSLVSKTNDPFISGLELVDHSAGKETKKLVKLSDTALFKDDRLVGWFNPKETRGLLWILGEVKSGIIVVDAPDDESKKVAIEIMKASRKVKPELMDGKPVMTVSVEEVGNLGEQMTSINMATPENFKELENRQANVIKEEIQAALDKAQALGVDVFKFGQEYHRKFPKEFPALEENWEEEFKKMTVNIEVKTKLNALGLTAEPVKD